MDKFTKQVLDRTVKDLMHNCQIHTNKGSVLCSDKYGSKIWLNENGTYSTLLVLGKFGADRGKFAQASTEGGTLLDTYRNSYRWHLPKVSLPNFIRGDLQSTKKDT